MNKISTTEYKAPDGKIKKLGYRTLHPLIKENLDILFVGINPHPLGVEKKHISQIVVHYGINYMKQV